MSGPNEDVANQLASLSIGTVGTTIFCAGPQQTQTGVPSQSIFCQLTGGYGTPIRYLQGPPSSGTPGDQLREPRVTIFVRSNPHDYAGGQTLARAVKTALHDQPFGSYYACRIVEAEPNYLYQTDKAEYVFNMNCHLYTEY